MTGERALVLYSGGQDSTVCLAWALHRFEIVETIGFEYSQRHAVELECRTAVRSRLAAELPHLGSRLGPDHVVRIDSLKEISESSLTSDVEIELGANGLPNSFVPGRNILFFTFAAALAYRRGVKHIVGGMCETDYSGYPDCRDDTIKALQVTLNLGMDNRFVLHTPLMWIDKAATWALADELGGPVLTDIILKDTHTCYLGQRTEMHPWGHGCGNCPACDLRVKGYNQWLAANA
jgi:7-cyano-7-deazaguanine synthase